MPGRCSGNPSSLGSALGECRELRQLGLSPGLDLNARPHQALPQSLAPESKPLDEGHPTRRGGQALMWGLQNPEGEYAPAQWLRRG